MALHITEAEFGPDERELKPQQWATYDGDVRHMAATREIVGPNTLGENLVAVKATFDDETGKTHVGFAYLPKIRREVEV